MSVSVKNNVCLQERNTFKMNVFCNCLVAYDSLEDLINLDLLQYPGPYKSIGGGSNLLFTGDYAGTLLHSQIASITEIASDNEQITLKVGAGVAFDDLCRWTTEQGWWGIENLSGIPGDVGAAAVQNVGAYGVEFKDVVQRVVAYNLLHGQLIELPVMDCGYGYRTSYFKTSEAQHLVVVYVIVNLSRKAEPHLDYGNLRQAVCRKMTTSCQLSPDLVRKTVMEIRSAKLPDINELGCAGSFFKNPVISYSQFSKILQIAAMDNGEDYAVPHFRISAPPAEMKASVAADEVFVKVPAAWMIEQCGWKGYEEGNVGVFEKQPLVLVNKTGKASPEEIISLENKIISSVFEKYGIRLHPEVEHI